MKTICKKLHIILHDKSNDHNKPDEHTEPKDNGVIDNIAGWGFHSSPL
jgi:hypothetical protein